MAIIYDNIKEGEYEYIQEMAYPVKIEYSFLNDKFWIIAYKKDYQTFIKMQLQSMNHISLSEEKIEGLRDEYRRFVKTNVERIVLDVDPVDHVIERCFRIFSYYDRKARYDEEANKYRLELVYQKFDEREIVRDVLSLGSSVLVIEPKRIQTEVINRIVQASSKYA